MVGRALDPRPHPEQAGASQVARRIALLVYPHMAQPAPAARGRGTFPVARPLFIVSRLGFPSQLRRMSGLFLLASHVPRLPRLLLGLRLRLQLLLRLATRGCGGCHVSSFSLVCQARGSARDRLINRAKRPAATRPGQIREAERTLLRLLRSGSFRQISMRAT
jgi:hypothetical protein